MVADTPKQGQYLAFIHLYTRLHRRPPAGNRHAAIHAAILPRQPTLGSPNGAHTRTQGIYPRTARTARSIELLVVSKLLPELL